MRSSLALLALSFALITWGCRGSSSTCVVPLASATIDSTGGTVTVDSGDLAGTSIMVPAGSLADPVTISIFAGVVSKSQVLKILGPAAEFQPDGTAFSLPAVMTLVFDPNEVPSTAQASDLAVQARSSTGGITELSPSSVDLGMGTATVDVNGFSTYWVTAPDTFATLEYFPLNNGDSYDYRPPWAR